MVKFARLWRASPLVCACVCVANPEHSHTSIWSNGGDRQHDERSYSGPWGRWSNGGDGQMGALDAWRGQPEPLEALNPINTGRVKTRRRSMHEGSIHGGSTQGGGRCMKGYAEQLEAPYTRSIHGMVDTRR